MKRLLIDLRAAGVAAMVTMMSLALTVSVSGHVEHGVLTASKARAESMLYLSGSPIQSHFVPGTTWKAPIWCVTDGHDMVRLDAESGELLEVEFRTTKIR